MRVVLALLALTVVSVHAHADIGPPHWKGIAHTYEIAASPALRGLVLVLWPTTCIDGKPRGTIAFDRDPRLKGQEREIDYEVVLPGRAFDEGGCAKLAHIYGLPEGDFPVDRRKRTVHALEALTLRERMELFEGDQRLRRSDYIFDPVGQVSIGSPLVSVHDVLVTSDVNEHRFELNARTVRYRYDDGKEERRTYHGITRPSPTVRHALD